MQVGGDSRADSPAQQLCPRLHHQDGAEPHRAVVLLPSFGFVRLRLGEQLRHEAELLPGLPPHARGLARLPKRELPPHQLEPLTLGDRVTQGGIDAHVRSAAVRLAHAGRRCAGVRRAAGDDEVEEGRERVAHRGAARERGDRLDLDCCFSAASSIGNVITSLLSQETT
eukprot:6100821-Prymnesium_polylepis.1